MRTNSFSLQNPWKGQWPSWATALFFLISYFLSIGIVLFLSPVGPLQTTLLVPEWQEGQIAERDIVTETAISFINEERTNQRIEANRRLVKPVFRVNERITDEIVGRFDELQTVIDSVLVLGYTKEVSFDFYLSEALDPISREVFNELLLFNPNQEFWLFTRNLLTRTIRQGIISPPTQVAIDNGIELISFSQGGSIRLIINRGDVIILEELSLGLANLILEEEVSFPGLTQAKILLESLLMENAFYDSEESEKSLQRVDWETPPVVERLEAGEVVIKSGYMVTPPVLRKLEGLRDYVQKLGLSSFLGVSLFFLVVFVLFYLMLSRTKPKEHFSPAYFLIYSGLWLIHLGIVASLSHLNIFSTFPTSIFFPTALFVVLVTVISDENSGALFGFFLAIPVLIIDRGHPEVFLSSLFGGLITPFLVSSLEKRIDLIKAGLFLSLLQGGSFFLVGLISNLSNESLGFWALGGLSNGMVSGILSLGLIPILEHLLNTPTRFRLAELSDLNAPIFKRMLSLAPGTYNHSVNVANLAESASEAIGANSLLARVGAYYHDIGKIDSAEYFVENQKGPNKHDEIKPSLSATILKSHVKVGLEKGKELGLPKRILDIITQHHGRGLMDYFYNKAVKEDGKAKKEDFSYPGPNPNFRESAVVMLSDTVEAATRSLEKPSITKLEKFIWELILKRYNEGLLNDSRLTFKDLDLIFRSFVRILAGQFHSRIKYPGQQEKPSKEKKP